MKTRPLSALAAICLFAAGTASSQDKLELYDGTVHKGKVISRDGTYTVLAGRKLYQFHSTQVKEVNGKSVAGDCPVAVIKTDVGDIKVVLFQDEAPNTVANFITLAEKGFYRGMSFHRIVVGFVAQGGCPESKEGANGTPGTGGPGYGIPDEIHPRLLHGGRGVLSMANAGPDTGGSQFFLCLAPAPHLDGKSTVFGRVVEGMGVLDKLEAAGTEGEGRPTKTIRFDVQILSKRDRPYEVRRLAPPIGPSAKPESPVGPASGR